LNDDFKYKTAYIQEHRNELLKRIGAGIAERLGDEKLDSEIYRISDALMAYAKTLDGGTAVVPLAFDLSVLRVLIEMTDVVPKQTGASN
jgi:hypothetical protein